MSAQPEVEPAAISPVKLRRRRTVLIFGKSQVGKSHICNVLMDRPGHFAEGDFIASCTMHPASEAFIVEDRQQNIEYEVTVVDTPGMFDTRPAVANNELLNNLSEFIKYSLEHVHRIFYVYKVGPVSTEEEDCLELLRSVLSDEALNSGICSLLITYCDRMSPPHRAGVVERLKQSNISRFLPMFAKGTAAPDNEPEIIPLDLSPGSETVLADRGRILQSILRADRPLHKNKAFRLFVSLAEAQERLKIRNALLSYALASGPSGATGARLKVVRDDKSVCPQQ